MNEIIKSELRSILPSELYMNVDYWMKIVENINSGINMIPLSFINHISFKYGYNVDVLKDKEIYQFIWETCCILNRRPELLKYTSPSSTITYGYSKKKTVVESEPKIKDRDKLCKEIPTAEFN